MLKEFKNFIVKGSVLDLAVAVIAGATVTAMVRHRHAADGNATRLPGLPSPFIGWNGRAVFDFLIIAFLIFLIVRAANQVRKPAPAACSAAKDSA